MYLYDVMSDWYIGASIHFYTFFSVEFPHAKSSSNRINKVYYFQYLKIF